MTNRLRWRIATTEAGLANNWFIALGVPEPTQVEYKDYSVKNSQSEGGIARHGYRTIKIMWKKLSPFQAWTIKTMHDNAKASATGLLFMTTLRLDASKPGGDWIDISGRPDMGDIAPEQPIISANGYSHDTVVLTISNVTILNDPASF